MKRCNRNPNLVLYLQLFSVAYVLPSHYKASILSRTKEGHWVYWISERSLGVTKRRLIWNLEMVDLPKSLEEYIHSKTSTRKGARVKGIQLERLMLIVHNEDMARYGE